MEFSSERDPTPKRACSLGNGKVPESAKFREDFVNSFPCRACGCCRDGWGNKTQGKREKGLALPDCAGAGMEPNMLGRKEAAPLPQLPPPRPAFAPHCSPGSHVPLHASTFARHSTNVFFLFSLNIWSAREVISIRQMALFLFRATQPSAGSGQGSAVLLFCRRWAGANV